MKKGEESELKKTPGIIRYASIGILCFLSWFDKRAVHILTNAYMPSGDLVVGHWYKALPGDAEAVRGKVKKSISIMIPPQLSSTELLWEVWTFLTSTACTINCN